MYLIVGHSSHFGKSLMWDFFFFLFPEAADAGLNYEQQFLHCAVFHLFNYTSFQGNASKDRYFSLFPHLRVSSWCKAVRCGALLDTVIRFPVAI